MPQTRLARRGTRLGSFDNLDTRLDASAEVNKKTEPGTRIASRLSLVPLTGVEPVRYFYRGILSPLRLPIPPQRHSFVKARNTVYHNFQGIANSFSIIFAIL